MEEVVHEDIAHWNSILEENGALASFSDEEIDPKEFDFHVADNGKITKKRKEENLIISWEDRERYKRSLRVAEEEKENKVSIQEEFRGFIQ